MVFGIMFLLYSAYNKLQNGIHYGWSIANQIFSKEKNNQSQEIILEKIDSIEKRIFKQIFDISTSINEMSHQIDTLGEKLEQIEEAQIYLRGEMENIGRHIDTESITRCRSYIKKIHNTLNSTSIALHKRPNLHEQGNFSSCDICVTLLTTFRNNLIQMHEYLELATPYLHSFRNLDIRSNLLNMFRTNSIPEGIKILSISIQTDQQKSCVNIQQTLEKFTTIFSNIWEEIMELHSYVNESIREEQLRRPSLQKINFNPI